MLFSPLNFLSRAFSVRPQEAGSYIWLVFRTVYRLLASTSLLGLCIQWKETPCIIYINLNCVSDKTVQVRNMQVKGVMCYRWGSLGCRYQVWKRSQNQLGTGEETSCPVRSCCSRKDEECHMGSVKREERVWVEVGDEGKCCGEHPEEWRWG